MNSRWLAAGITAACLLLPLPARAWDDTGHKVVARIAWDHMTPEARQSAITVLKQGSDLSDLNDLFPTDSRPLVIREREFFLRASTWPDIVRDEGFPERRAAFHQRDWHFTNFFWKQVQGQPIDVTTLHPNPVNVVERLEHFDTTLGDTTGPPDGRAVELAWTVHLVGDIHQPLHSSARVTAQEPGGDQGGNLFKLTGGPSNLHSYWDQIVTRSIPRKSSEQADAYINRIAALFIQRHPQDSMTSTLKSGQFAAWAREGLATAKAVVYPSSLKRSNKPKESYRKTAFDRAEPAITLGGYRLAEMLNRLLGA
jgi:hypothetical protein